MTRDELIAKTVPKEELRHIEEFCLASSRMERMEIIATLKREYKAIKNEVDEAFKKRIICGHLHDNTTELIKRFRGEFKKYNETEKVAPEVTKLLMINFRVLRRIVEDSLEQGFHCRDEVAATS